MVWTPKHYPGYLRGASGLLYALTDPLGPHLKGEFFKLLKQCQFPIRKYVRYSTTSHGSAKQTCPTSLIFFSIPKITLKYLERMKIDQVSLFLQRFVENKDDLPSLQQTKPQLRQSKVKIANIDDCLCNSCEYLTSCSFSTSCWWTRWTPWWGWSWSDK